MTEKTQKKKKNSVSSAYLTWAAKPKVKDFGKLQYEANWLAYCSCTYITPMVLKLSYIINLLCSI